MSERKTQIATLLATLILGTSMGPVRALEPEWSLVRPSNTGVPGELIQDIHWAPDGDLWVGARWPFWEEGGIGAYDPVAETWSAQSDWETPLPSEFIYDIAFDSSGTVWIATARGLARYDGSEWTVYDPSNAPFSLYKVTDISIAPNGTIWFNNSDFNSGGDAIWSFDGVSEWHSFSVPGDLPWAAPWTDLQDVLAASDGTIWVSNTTLNGLARYDGVTWTLFGADESRFTSLSEDLDGNIWMIGNPVGTPFNYFKFDGSSFTTWPLAGPKQITVDSETGDIYVSDSAGRILRTTDGGASWPVWASGLNTVYGVSPRPGSDEVWIRTIGAVGRFNGDGTWIEDFNSYNSGMPWYWIDNAITQTTDGMLWFASNEAGLSRFDGEQWRNWGNHNQGSEEYPFAGSEPMYGVYEDSRGNIWMGGNGIARWNPVTNSITGFWNWQSNPGIGSAIKLFAEDVNGTLFAFDKWTAVFRFNGTDWEQDTGIVLNSRIPGVEVDRDGVIWAAGRWNIASWDGSVWTSFFEIDGTLISDFGSINSFTLDTNDVFWLGMDTGLLRWDGVDITFFDSTNSPLPENNVRDLDIRDDGLIGLTCLDFNDRTSAVVLIAGDPVDPSNWSTFLHGQSPIPHWQIGEAAFDANGSFWISAESMGTVVLSFETPASVESEATLSRPWGALHQNQPNPFESRTQVSFRLNRSSQVSLELFDVQGRLQRVLVDGVLPAGRHELGVDGQDLESGVYFYQLRQGGEVVARKQMTVLR